MSLLRAPRRITNDCYLIADLEATCSDDGAVRRHEMEIIEIGAATQRSRTFVDPVRHPELTDPACRCNDAVMTVFCRMNRRSAFVGA